MAHEILKSMSEADADIEIQFFTRDGRWASPRGGPHWEPETNYRIRPGTAAARAMRHLLEGLAAQDPFSNLSDTDAVLEKARAIVGDLRNTISATGEVDED